MTQTISLAATVPREASGQRLDQIAAQLFPNYSRSRIQEWIKRGELTLAGRIVKPNLRVAGGEAIQITAQTEVFGEWQAEPMDLNVVYEDSAILVINKPANLVVHPAAGNYDGTLLNGLLHYLPALAEVPRAGIVHRLDKDTTGLMVVAKTLTAQTDLVSQLQARSVKRLYRALALGPCPFEGAVDAPIGRDCGNRKKMAVTTQGKEAVTHYRVLERFSNTAYLQLQLQTGRTHQIRVHMAHLGFPLVGDSLYGRRATKSLLPEAELRQLVNEFPRQALHAFSLSLNHPDSGERMTWEAPLPEDFESLLDILDRLRVRIP